MEETPLNDDSIAAKISRRQRYAKKYTARTREIRAASRSIGPIPPVEDPDRRGDCERSLLAFIRTYAMTGKSEFSETHLRVIDHMQGVIEGGGKYLEILPRSSGKSTLTELAAVWALLYGKKKFLPIITANGSRSADMIRSMRTLLLLPDLVSDFPSVAYPIQALDGVFNRAATQTYTDPDGIERQTNMRFSASGIIFPDIREIEIDGERVPNPAAESRVTAMGILSSSVRGPRHALSTGEIIRPDCILLDDILDEGSAVSAVQNQRRMNVITQGLLSSGGHTSELSVLMTATVLAQGDAVDQLSNRRVYPDWLCTRVSYFNTFPARIEMWEKYWAIAAEFDPEDLNSFFRARAKATEYYVEHRVEMDDGASVYWDHCFNEHEVSSIQHGMNALRTLGERAFWSEYQNKPKPAAGFGDSSQLVEADLITCCRPGEGIDPRMTKVVAFVDIQERSLWYVIMAVAGDYTCQVLETNIYPEQDRKYLSAREIRKSLFDAYPGAGQEGVWYQGIRDALAAIFAKRFMRSDNVEIPLVRVLLDGNQGQVVDTLISAVNNSPHRNNILISRGRGITASQRPMSEYTVSVAAGEKKGPNWVISKTKAKVPARYILSDINYWKTFARARIKTAQGDPGCMIITGDPRDNRMLIDHCLAEYSVMTSGRGRTLNEWKLRPGRRDEHFWDGLVGCLIAASESGTDLPGVVKSETISQRELGRQLAGRVVTKGLFRRKS